MNIYIDKQEFLNLSSEYHNVTKISWKSIIKFQPTILQPVTLGKTKLIENSEVKLSFMTLVTTVETESTIK